MNELLPPAEAIAAVLERVRPLPAERVPLVAAAGRVLAEPARATVDLPPFPSSAMDGYAVRAADTPGRLPVVFRIAAGRPARRPLEPAEAMAIATGGVVPSGADAVVPVELVSEQDGLVEVSAPVEVGANVRPRGGDVSVGGEVVSAGSLLGPARIGALAAAGVAEVECATRPRVAVLTTGTELRPPGSELAPGEIFESNGLMLVAQLERAGAVVEWVRSAADDEAEHREALAAGLSLDVLVTSGGVSVGPHDLVRRVLGELGVEEVFWGVAMRPGKPVSFGVRGRTLVFGLPGNPVSSLVGCEVLVRPALAALQGLALSGPHYESGVLVVDVPRDRRDTFVRATTSITSRGVELTPVRGQDSHMIVRAASADALVLVPRGEGVQAAGSAVRYLRI